MGWDMENIGTLATGSAGEIRARRLMTGCWRGPAYHSPFPADFRFAFRLPGLIAISDELDRRAKMFQGGASIAPRCIVLGRLNQFCEGGTHRRVSFSQRLNRLAQHRDIDRHSSLEAAPSLA